MYIYLMPFLVIAILLIVVLGLRYLFLRVRSLILRGRSLQTFSRKEKIITNILAGIPIFVMAFLCVIRPYFWVIPIMHLMLFWGALETILSLIQMFITRRHKKEEIEKDILHKGKFYSFLFSAGLALILTALYLGISYYLAHHLYETKYQVKTDREPLKIALIADTHINSSFDGEEFAEYVKMIGQKDPDIMVVVGDFVDEHTKEKDMLISCQALGEIKTIYGVFFVPGNHDDSNNKLREFTYTDLLNTLRDNGVVVLEDDISYINDDYCIVGRKDKSMKRLKIDELMKKVDPSYYTIVLDHQPNDYDAEAEAGCDLVLAGHTHGGHMVPIAQIAELLRINDSTYGLEQRGDTTFIVTSGMSNWAISFKSGTITEYCIVDLVPE